MKLTKANREKIEREFDKFYHRHKMGIPEKHYVMILNFLIHATEEARKEGEISMGKKVGEALKETFRGCSCGLHGYQVLPDCDEEKHANGCADCAIDSLLSPSISKIDKKFEEKMNRAYKMKQEYKSDWGCSLCEDGPQINISLILIVILFLMVCTIYGFLSITYQLGLLLFGLIK